MDEAEIRLLPDEELIDQWQDLYSGDPDYEPMRTEILWRMGAKDAEEST